MAKNQKMKNKQTKKNKPKDKHELVFHLFSTDILWMYFIP